MNLLWLDLLFMFITSFPMSYVYSKILTPKINGLLTSVIYSTGVVLVNYIFNYSDGFEALIPDYVLRMNIKMFVMPTFTLLFFILSFKEKTIKKIFSLFLAAIANLICETVFGLVISSIYTDIVAATVREMSWEQKIIYYLVGLIGYVIGAIFLYAVCKHKEIKSDFPLITTFVAIMFVNMFLFLTIINNQSYSHDFITQAMLFLAPLMMLMLCVVSFILMRKLKDREVLREKLYWLESVKGIELDYYNKLQDKTNDMRRIRHDFKGVIDSINLLISENTPESLAKAKELLTSLNNSLNLTKIPVYSRNLIANAVIAAKDEEAKNEQIEMNIAVDIPEEISVEAIDLNCVFLNMLNNAIESCKKLPIGQRKIVLKATIQAGYLMIKTENPYLSVETDKQGKIKTSKKDTENHGFGLSLIEDISKKYDGHFQIDTTDGKFITTVSLGL